MIFRVFRASRLPLALEDEEVHILNTLEAQGRWVEFEDYQDELKDADGLMEIIIDVQEVEELKFILTAIDETHSFVIDFERKFIEIQDIGRDC